LIAYAQDVARRSADEIEDSIMNNIVRSLIVVSLGIAGIVRIELVARELIPTEQDDEQQVLRIREVTAGYGESVSKDGRFVTLRDLDTGKVMIRDLRLNTTRALTAGYPEFGMYSQISPNSEWIAYSWRNKDADFELRVIKFDGSKPNTILAAKSTNYFVRDWSAASDQILVEIMDRELGRKPPVRVAFVSLADHKILSEHTLKHLPGEYIRISPNGKMLAYTAMNESRDINLYSLDRREEINVVSHLATDRFMDWGREGNWLLFSSDREGPIGLWALPIDATSLSDKSVDAVRLVADLGGRSRPLGTDDNGWVYYRQGIRENDLFLAGYDPGAARIGPPKKTESGLSSGPLWARDGKRLAYFRGLDLVLHTLLDGKKHELTVELTPYHSMNPTWSADGKSILVGAKRNGAGSLV
jgi:hypothetical protein